MLDALSFYRVAHRLHRAGFRRIAQALTKASRIAFSAHVPAGATIGEGCELGYGGLGVIIHSDAVIGNEVLISPGVVIGGRSELKGVPVIEDGVKIGCGAKVLGPIRVGRGANIGANAVVVHDVAAGDTVVGIPARSLQRGGVRQVEPVRRASDLTSGTGR
jgi:serine O-acetyltransferase